MIALVTADEMQAHLRYDDDHLVECETIRTIACAIAAARLKIDSMPDLWNDALGSPSGNGVPGDVKAAVLLIGAEFDKNRSAAEADLLSPTVRMLLDPYRDPTLA